MGMKSSSVKCYSEITSNLLLGNQYATSSVWADAILSIGCNHKSQNKSAISLKISIKDSADSDLTPYLDEATSFIRTHILADATVLVHCKGGINRSPAFVIAYLSLYEMSLEDAITLVTTKRSSVRL